MSDDNKGEDGDPAKKPCVAPAEGPTLASLYEAICRGLDHEAKVMNDRLTWAILFTAGLFAATAILMTAAVSLAPELSVEAPTTPQEAQALEVALNPLYGQYSLILVLAMLIAGIAIWFSFATKGGVEAAQNQFDYLRKRYDKFKKLPGTDAFPRPYGSITNHTRGNRVARTFPWVMIAIWGGALVAEAAAFLYFFGKWFPPP